VFEPGLIFVLALCFFLFSLSLFIANSFVTFGSTVVGIAFLVLMFLLGIALFGTSIRGAVSVVSIFFSLRLSESPLLFLFIMICGGMVFATLSLLEISFDELRDVKNRRWINTLAAASLLSIALLIGTTGGVAGAASKPASLEFKQIFAGLNLGNIRQAVVAVADDAVYTIRTQPVKSTRSVLVDPTVERIVKVDGQPYVLVRQKRARSMLAYRSEKPIWGQEIRFLYASSGGIRRVSPGDYSQSNVLGEPFVSPDADRIAYLRTSTPRFWGKATTSLWITKLNFSVSDYAELPGDVETTQWEPIGWTPDGYKFLLRKKEAGKSEIWAVDWVARGPTRFLEEFPDAIITEDDLPKDGEWFSLVRRQDDGKWDLRLVNYRRGESKSLGTFDSEPVRKWSGCATLFAHWESASGITVTVIVKRESLHFKNLRGADADGMTKHEPMQRIFTWAPDIHSVLQMRWSPLHYKLALVVKGGKAWKEGIPRLVTIDPYGSHTMDVIAENFPAEKHQWGWLDGSTIIYADGDRLLQKSIGGQTIFLLSLSTMHDNK
jgi:hypothetical protein